MDRSGSCACATKCGVRRVGAAEGNEWALLLEFVWSRVLFLSLSCWPWQEYGRIRCWIMLLISLSESMSASWSCFCIANLIRYSCATSAIYFCSRSFIDLKVVVLIGDLRRV